MRWIEFLKKVFSWFESYVSGRNFKFNIDKKFTDSGNLTCGVPCGSALGPISFLLYVNDMSQAEKCDISHYAENYNWRKR